MKIATQAEKNPELARVSAEVIWMIGGGKRENSGIATRVHPNSSFPGIPRAMLNAGVALRAMDYSLVEGSEKTVADKWRNDGSLVSSSASYTNGTRTFTVGAYFACGLNFSIREEKL